MRRKVRRERKEDEGAARAAGRKAREKSLHT